MPRVRSLRPIPALAALSVLFGTAPRRRRRQPRAEENPAHQPPFGDEPLAPLVVVHDLDRPPAGFQLNGAEAIEIADTAQNVIDERAESPAMEPRVSTRGEDRWQIDYFDDGTDVAQAVVDDRTGTVVEAWRNQQVEVKLARGYEGAVGGNVSKAWIWIPLCILFVLPFVDPKRPFRLLHLDLLVLLSFSVSQFFFNKGEIVWSVPLVYPALGYLFVRMMIAGFRPRDREGPLVPGRSPIRWLAIAAVVLAIFRIGMNVVDSQVIDIGFANVVGADRIADGDGVYDGQFTPLIDRGDSYGPFNYISYIPFEQLLPWDGGLESLPAAHVAAILFDLARRRAAPARRASSARGQRGSRSRRGPRLRLVRLPVHALCARRQRRQRRAVAALLVAALIAFASPRQARAGHRPGGGDQVRPAGAGAAVRGRVGGAAHPLDRDLRRRLRRRLGRRPAAAPARRRLPRVLRPHVRLPGLTRFAVQRLGSRAVAGRPAGHCSGLPGVARHRRLLPARPPDARYRSPRSEPRS